MYIIDTEKLKTTEQIAEFVVFLFGERDKEQYDSLLEEYPEIAQYLKEQK